MSSNWSLVVEILVFINKFAPLCSSWSLVEILVFLNKFAPLGSLWCLVRPTTSFKLMSKKTIAAEQWNPSMNGQASVQ